LIEVERLLTPVSAELPCGPNLEYDQEFINLEEAAHVQPERQSGSTVIPAKVPEWADVRRRSEALLARTKDLRVAVHLCRALTRTEGFPGLQAGLTIVQQLSSRYWDQVYPLIESPDQDPTMRMNTFAPLADPEGQMSDPDGLLSDVRSLNIVASPAGRATVRDLLVAQKKLQAVGGAPALSVEAIEGLIRDSAGGPAGPPPVKAMEESLQAINALDTYLSEKVGATGSLNMKSLREALAATVAACRSALGVTEAAPPSASDDSGPGSPGLPASGEIRRREDVVSQLDKICEFLQRTEPGHPAPLLLRRAQRLLTKNFLEIIEDLAPESLGQVQKVAGVEKK